MFQVTILTVVSSCPCSYHRAVRAAVLILLLVVSGCALVGREATLVDPSDDDYELSCGTFEAALCLDLAGRHADEYRRQNPGFKVTTVEVRRADARENDDAANEEAITEAWVCGRRPAEPGFETVCALVSVE